MSEKKRKTTSLVLPDGVKQSIEELAKYENISLAAMYRKLIYTGLKASHDIDVRNNQVVRN